MGRKNWQNARQAGKFPSRCNASLTTPNPIVFLRVSLNPNQGLLRAQTCTVHVKNNIAPDRNVDAHVTFSLHV